MQQALFDSGYEVGRMATERYPGGILIEELLTSQLSGMDWRGKNMIYYPDIMKK
jgi:hypothetical protein